jgi:hypothetical protein
MINNKFKKYIFIKNLDEKIIKNIKKIDNIQIIFNNEDFNDASLKQCIEIRDFCLKNKIPLYLINNYKIICNKIYCNFHKIYIPVETYVAIHGDTSMYFSIELKNGRCKRVLGFETNNNLINNKLLVDKNKIILSYGLISLLHALEEIELLEEIDKHNNESFNIKWNNYNIIINY